jgi:hypothetical protein
MKQLSLGLETGLAGPAVPLPEDIEAEVIAQLAEAIKVVHTKGEEVGDAESHDE